MKNSKNWAFFGLVVVIAFFGLVGCEDKDDDNPCTHGVGLADLGIGEAKHGDNCQCVLKNYGSIQNVPVYRHGAVATDTETKVNHIRDLLKESTDSLLPSEATNFKNNVSWIEVTNSGTTATWAGKGQPFVIGASATTETIMNRIYITDGGKMLTAIP